MNNPPGGGNPPQQGRPMSFAQQSQQLHMQTQQQQRQPMQQPMGAQPQMQQQQQQQFVTSPMPQQTQQHQQVQPHMSMPVQQQTMTRPSPSPSPQQGGQRQNQAMMSPQQQQYKQQPQMMSPQQQPDQQRMMQTPQQQQQPGLPQHMLSPQQQMQGQQMVNQHQGMATPQQQGQQQPNQMMTTPTPQQQQQQMQQQQQQQQMQQQQQQQMQGQQPQPSPGEQLDAGSTPSIKSKIKGFFHQEHQGPNFGFKPTAAMAQRHEDSLVSGKRPFFQFQVTKLRSWRSGYVRLLCLYDDHFATFDPDSHQVTNTWNYSNLTDFVAADKDQLLLQVNSDKLKFQCHNVDRSMVLSSLLQCQDEHTPIESPMILCNRWTRHGTQVPCALRVTPYALVEVHPSTKKRIQTYRYFNILAISFTTDDATGLILHFKNKKTTRLFAITTVFRSDVVTFMRQHFDRIGLELRMTDSSTVAKWKDARRLQQQTQTHTIATEWNVTKQSRRHDAAVVGSSNGWPGGLVQRTLCITGDGLILEKDTSGMVIAARPLSEIYALVRPSAVGDRICVEYDDGDSRTYSSPSRDSLLVSLLDAATTLGKNPKVQVSEVPSGGYCLASFAKSATPEKSGGLFQPISIPTHCLKRVHAVATAAFSYMNSNSESSTEEGVTMNPIEECRNVMEVCREFNASVLPTAEGLPTAEKDKFVLGSIGALWGVVAELLDVKKDRHLAEQTAGPMFQTLHRLSKTNAGYKNSIELATFVDCLPLLWTIEDAFCKFWAFRALTVLLSGLPTRDKELEYVNKSVIFKAGGVRLVHGLVLSLLNQEKSSDLIRMVMSDILQSLLCTYADTTSPEAFGIFIRCLGENYQALLGTLYQQTPFVIENSALLLHLLSTHAPDVAAAIREAALSSAILLHHFHSAIFSPLEGQRFLSRFLCSLWLAGPMDCSEKKLLKRMAPSGFMGYLKMPRLSRVEEEQLDEIERDLVEQNVPEDNNEASGIVASGSNASGAAGTNTARLRSRIALARATHKDPNRPTPENFRIFFHVLTQNHSLPDLIWNQQTRRELRIGLESEIQYIQRETQAKGMGKIAWNHQQFGISYPSLESELRVGSVYMRLWLQAGDGFIKTWEEPLRLFELLFRRFLCEMDRDAKVTIMCIRCLERLYSIHGENIGAFPDVMILIRSMAATRSIETQHRLLGLLATILGVQEKDEGDEAAVNIPENAEQLLNTESIQQLCQFVAWGHTNGLQVGNLMTSILGNIKPGFAMLTDGTQQGPEAYKGDEEPSKDVDADAICPAVWFIASTGRIPPPTESIRGPFRVSELQRMMELGDLSPFTLVTSTHVESYEDEEQGEGGVGEAQIDTGKWKRLDQVWQLRWQLCTDGSGGGIFSPSDVSLRAIRSLTRLVDLHKSLDSRGVPYAPIPIAKRIMCGLNRDAFKSEGAEASDHAKSFLSIVAQAILCNDPEVVDYTAELLFKLTQYNEEATSKLYLTGVFFFVASYTGSNFKNLAKLLHSTHLSQHFRSGFAATADKSELPLKERSILGTMLPEGVLYILFNYGVERFAAVFVGNYDTPEVIWSVEMRRHLIEMVTQHLGDFTKRLWQNTTTEYEYCPMPGMAYKRLEKEIFCHNYYLHNLCNEKRFPEWPISEPVEVFRACLEELKKQMNRDEEDEEQALQRALKVLVLKPGDGSKELRKAYRSLARKYHPDKVSNVIIRGYNFRWRPLLLPFRFCRILQGEKCSRQFKSHMSSCCLSSRAVRRSEISRQAARISRPLKTRTCIRALKVL
jgi:DnaJ family protein C protein 13